MRTLCDVVPVPLVVRGQEGYWGASPELEALTRALVEALTVGDSTKGIVEEIRDELFCERAPTGDQMGFDEDAYWAGQLELQQRLWEAQGNLYSDLGLGEFTTP
jgi:hypothetical protein